MVQLSAEGLEVGVSPAAAVRVAWERYVGGGGEGGLVGESPTVLHADLTFAGEPVVSAQSLKKSKHREAPALADTPV